MHSQISTQIEADEVLVLSFFLTFLGSVRSWKGVSVKYFSQCWLLTKVFAALKSDKSGKKIEYQKPDIQWIVLPSIQDLIWFFLGWLSSGRVVSSSKSSSGNKINKRNVIFVFLSSLSGHATLFTGLQRGVEHEEHMISHCTFALSVTVSTCVPIKDASRSYEKRHANFGQKLFNARKV